ncbi:hypothetical protein LLJ53_11150 [Pseudomonas aeruginosa]|uniref:hypothetical protein n=1 Tax=Pseudomonas aeruginosa TaxID=287 RepID=UPI0021E3C5D8|nr:hypothetical protein [Pseudomonas aeruginosa]UYF86561.1 hypothetical protein LLJ53_11150 [Pseudomonas aeruginosa]
MNADSLNTTKYSADYARFFHAESLQVLQGLELAMKLAVDTYLTLSNPFNVFAFQAFDEFYSCEVDTIINPMSSQMTKLAFKIKPFTEQRLWSVTKEISERVVSVEFSISKKGLSVKQYMLDSDSFWINTDNDKALFGHFATLKSQLFRPMLELSIDVVNKSGPVFGQIENHVNTYFIYQSTAFKDLKKHFSKELLQTMKRNEEEWYEYRNKVEAKESLLAGVNPLIPDEYGLNVLHMVMGIDYPEFLALYFKNAGKDK